MAALGDILYRGSTLWKRLVGNTAAAKKFLSQTGTGSASAAPAWAQVAEADLAFTDITTNDVSASKHGFVPKAPNDSTKFLNGLGAWAVGGGGGGGGGGVGNAGLTLLEQHTASNSASLDFTNWYSADYDEYVIEVIGLIPATSGVDLWQRFSTDGGANYDAGANYEYGRNYTASNAASAATSYATNATGCGWWIVDLANAPAAGLSGTARLLDPGSTTKHKTQLFQCYASNASGTFYNIIGSMRWRSNSAVNAIRFIAGSGNLTSGTVRIYGVSKAQAMSIGGGAMALLEQHATAASVASLDFASFISSNYDDYLVEFENVVPVTDAVSMVAEVSTDGGVTWKNTSYKYAGSYTGSGGATGNNTSNAATSIFVGGPIKNTSSIGLSGTMRAYNPNGTASARLFRIAAGILANDGNYYNLDTFSSWVDATAVNALRFKMDSGNIASGTIRIYGIAKTASVPTTIKTGTFASRPVPLVDGSLYLPSDGLTISRDNMGSSWDTWGPLSKCAAPPTGVWSWRNQGSSSVTETAEVLRLLFAGTPNATGTNAVLRAKTPPATPYTVTVQIVPPPVVKLYLGYGLALRQNGAGTGTGRLVTFWWCPAGSGGADVGGMIRIEKWTSETSFTSSYVEMRGAQPRFFRIADGGTNLVFSVSSDGLTWLQLYSVSRIDWMLQGPDQIGIFAFTQNVATPNIDVPVTVLSWKEE